MRRFLIHATVGLVLSAIGVFAAILPFDPSRGLVEIPVVINGKITGKFGIDTGADKLYIDKTFAEKNGLHATDVQVEHRVIGVDGASSSVVMSLRSLEIQDLPTLTDLPATLIDMKALNISASGNHPDGLLGFDVLSRFFVTVNYPEHTIELRTVEPRSLSGKPQLVIPYAPANHLIIVNVSVNGLPAVPMILDYCANFTTITTALANKLGFATTNDTYVTLDTVIMADAVKSTGVKAVVTDLNTYRTTLGLPRLEGILGGTFLGTHVVTIDYAHSVIYVQNQ